VVTVTSTEWSSGSAYDLFLDGGKPILRECAVAFLDVLGIRALSNAPERLETLRRLISGLGLAREEAMLESQESWQALSWFTDNVVVAFPILPGHIDEEPALGSALRAAAYIQLRMAISGFLVRGGISFGEIHMAPNVAFGPALIEAVELEAQAKSPRVLLSDEAVSLQRKVMKSYARGAAPQSFEMAVDSDDAVFVDYLHVWAQEEHDDSVFRFGFKAHRDQARRGLEDSPDDVRPKYEWLAGYHNWTAEALRGPGRLKIRDWPAGQFRRF
jgi:class 3 adenylate cyclase